MMLSDEVKQTIVKLQGLYPEKRSALIPALHIAQAEVGYLPLEAQEEVARLFGIELSEVHAVVTFYDMFHEKPVGKHLIHLCTNISCLLRGGDELLGTLCRKLQVNPREMSADGEFTVIPSECLAACDRAPMMLVDERVVGPVKLDELDAILQEAKERAGRAASIEKGEVSHA